MRAGQLRKRVDIQQVVLSYPDALGTVAETYTTIATVWARFDPLDAKRKSEEVEWGGQQEAKTYFYVTIRYFGDALVNSKCRLSLHPSGRIFAIEAIMNEDERNRMSVLKCIEVT